MKFFVCQNFSNVYKRIKINSVDVFRNLFSMVILFDCSLSKSSLLSFVEKDLLQELQKCRRTTKAPTPTASGASSGKKLSLPARLDIHLKNVEDERDMYRNETEILQKLLNERSRTVSSPSSSPSRLRGRSVSPTPGSRASVRRDMATSPVMQLSKRSASGGSISPTRCTVCGINRHRSSPTKVRENETRYLIDSEFRI